MPATSLRIRDLTRAVKKQNQVIREGGLCYFKSSLGVCAAGAVVCLVNLNDKSVRMRDHLSEDIRNKAEAMEVGFENRIDKDFLVLELGNARYNRYKKMGQKLRELALERA
jgi:hypothetical protein